jgi:hypothetical protein
MADSLKRYRAVQFWFGPLPVLLDFLHVMLMGGSGQMMGNTVG